MILSGKQQVTRQICPYLYVFRIRDTAVVYDRQHHKSDKQHHQQRRHNTPHPLAKIIDYRSTAAQALKYQIAAHYEKTCNADVREHNLPACSTIQKIALRSPHKYIRMRYDDKRRKYQSDTVEIIVPIHLAVFALVREPVFGVLVRCVFVENVEVKFALVVFLGYPADFLTSFYLFALFDVENRQLRIYRRI